MLYFWLRTPGKHFCSRGDMVAQEVQARQKQAAGEAEG